GRGEGTCGGGTGRGWRSWPPWQGRSCGGRRWRRRRCATPTRTSTACCGCRRPRNTRPSRAASTVWPPARSTPRGLYRLAAVQLDRALQDPRWTAIPEQAGRADLAVLKPAVILDVDETVLDNSPEEGQRVRDRVAYAPDLFRLWAARTEAGTVPGAAEFLKYTAARGVEIFLVTNRDPDWRDETIETLRKDGIPIPDDHVLCFGERGAPEDPGDKSGRRQFVASSHRVLLLAGAERGACVAHD